VEGGITAARAERDTILGARGRGERVQSNPRMRFGDAADRWLSEQVAALRPATRAIYRNAVVNHLRPRWGTRRMDAIGVDDVAKLVRGLRAQDLFRVATSNRSLVLVRLLSYRGRAGPVRRQPPEATSP
jgi:hypothetical protein